MPTPTIAVTCAASDQGGESVAGGIYTAKLDQTEIYDGFVVPEQVTATADADGLAILNLWPNALGVNGSSYRITARNPDTGKKFFDASVVVPNNPCNLYQIIQNAPFPNVDSAQQALIDVQALVTIANQDVATTNADAQQTTADRLQTGEDRTAARDSAANALTSENMAGEKAAEASGHANAASGQAVLAANAAATTQTLRDSIIATQGAIGYLPPVAYVAGLSMTLPAQTVSYAGQAYAPLLSALPFTTSGAFETAKFRLIQGVAAVNLAAAGGAMLVGNDGETVAQSLNALQLADYAALRAYAGPRRNVFITGYQVGAVPSGKAEMYVRDDSDTASLDDGAAYGAVIVDNLGRRWKAAVSLAKPQVVEYASAAINRLPGQIAQNSEKFVVDGNAIYTLAKGSYSKADNSFVQGYKLHNGAIVKTSTLPLDLGLGANCRAMVGYKTRLYVFKEGQIKTIDTTGYAPVIIDTYTRATFGFVESAFIYGEFMIAPVWGDSLIEVYRFSNGLPVLVDSIATPTTGNASIVDGKDGNLYCIAYQPSNNQLARFQLSPSGKIKNYMSYTVPGMVNCRYGEVRQGLLYTGSFGGGGSLVAVSITDQSPVVARSFPNMTHFTMLSDRYLLGTDIASQSVKLLDMRTGLSEATGLGRMLYYPKVVGEHVVAFYNGTEAPAAGASANDSVMGEKFAILATKRDAIWKAEPAQIQPPPVQAKAGTFTPLIVGITTTGEGTYTKAAGRYSIIGNQCFYTLELNWTAHTGAGRMSIQGLPVKSAAVGPTLFVGSVITSNITYPAGETYGVAVAANSLNISIYRQAPAGLLNLADLDTSGALYISGTYEVHPDFL